MKGMDWGAALARAENERDEWKARRDAAVEECRVLHQEGMSRRDHHLKHCGAARAAAKAETERDDALDEVARLRAQVAAVEEFANEWERDEAYACVNAAECVRCVTAQRSVIRIRTALRGGGPR